MSDENKIDAPRHAPTWLLALIGAVACLALAVALAAWIAAPAANGTGTYICEDPTGSMSAAKDNNPANCGPDDRIFWCKEWDATNNKCVG